MRRTQQFIYGQLSWMLATIVGLVALGMLSIELFVIGSLLGLLVLVELSAPVNVTPSWRSRLRWVVLLGMILFGYFMLKRVLAVLPDGFL